MRVYTYKYNNCEITSPLLATHESGLDPENGDDEVEASFTESEVANSDATGLTYYNVEWKQRPTKRRK